MGRGKQEEGDGEGGKGKGEKNGAGGEGISQMDMMKCLGGIRLQSFLTLFTRATPGTPASLWIKTQNCKFSSHTNGRILD